ncbi:complement factor H-like [Thunnus albacares]|uniref:complement factor H-like n=1 Tax=Thunnus albacares TaxID=8236 RepID=UPI001CF6F229|nr:complement factor H-like [Thunnus albacares]
MCIRYLGYLLLIWFPGLHAKTTSCPAPELEDGYFLPERKNYFDKDQVTYACNKGSKPDVEGWWATSTCQEGKWHPEPKCIGKDACTSPNIPNAKCKYDNELTIRVTCDKGYIINDSRKATSTCENGTWSSLPVCEESPEACGAPPKIPNAVIINQEYQDVFAADSEVQYECKDGFTVEGADTKKTITCVSSEWSTGPPCSGGSGSAVGGTGGGHTTSAGSGTQPTGGGSGSAVGGTGGRHTTSAGSGTQPTGGGRGSGSAVGGTGGGHTTSAGSGTQPTGSSTTSDRDSRPLFTTIDNCGDHPSVPHGDVVVKEQIYLKYQCQKYYKREGPETVVCHNDGTWSKLPVCKGSSTTSDRDSRPLFTTIDNCGDHPSVPHGDVVVTERMYLKYQCQKYYKYEGPETVVCHNDGTWSKLPVCKGSSTTSDRDSRPLFTTIDNCGDHPSVPHGDVVVTERMYLKYQCQNYYKYEGPETVVCHNDGTWSKLPVCKESFCVIDPADLVGRGFKLSGVQYMTEGEEKYISCGWDRYSLFRCTNRQISVTECCTGYYHQQGQCSARRPLFGSF